MLRFLTTSRVASRAPDFIADLWREPGTFPILVAASLALFAVGLDPKVLSSGLPDAQAALRERPQLEAVFLLSAMVQAAFLLIGGVIGDALGRRRVLLVGLVGLTIAELAAIVFPSGVPLLAVRLAATAFGGIVLPVALSIVAVAYTGIPRATALGMAYAALGASSALAPALLIAVTPSIGRWPSFVLAAIALAVAAFVVVRKVPDTLPSGLRLRQIAPHAIWAFGLLAITGGLIGFRANSESLIRIGLIIAGIALVAIFLWGQRRRPGMPDGAAIDVRPATVAIIAGVILAIAQTAPLLELPLFFQISQRYSALAATVALAPFIIALIISGPIAGALLARYSPRTLICGGLAVVGIGNVALAQATPSSSYIFFVLPFFLVGAGFVVGTSVRTAVIFASTPSRLPSTAAALNQASFTVGGQAGVAAITALVSGAAIAFFGSSQPAPDPAAVDGFRNFLEAIGTAQFGEIVGNLDSSATALYGDAFAAGVQYAVFFAGVTALVGAALVWFAMPRSQPVTSIWDTRDEREVAAEVVA
jgi:MFS family permease